MTKPAQARTPEQQWRSELRRAMGWWRARNPEESPFVKVRNHGWYGSVLWTTKGEAGVVMSTTDLMREYRDALAKGAA